MKSYGKLLQRQIRKAGFTEQELARLAPFLQTVDQSYAHYDADHELLTRSLDLSSRELHQKNQSLEQKTEMLDRFIYRITHDLKSPVNNMLALSTMLIKMQEKQGGMPLEVARKIQDSARNLLERVGELLEVARTEQVSQPLAEACNVREIIGQIEAEMSEQIAKSGTQLQIEVDAAPHIHFPKRNLESILHNLISNAIKYSKAGVPPQIAITTSEWKSGILLKVTDNGLGMDLDVVGPKLFGLFNRFHSHVEGTGVGLYLVKKMTEENGGKLELDSQLGIGSEFRLFLKNYSLANA